MPRYNLLEYSDNYADSSGCLWQFKRDEQNITAAVIPNAVTTDNSSSFKYKSSLLGESAAGGANRKFKDVKIVVPLKYLCNFFRSLEMPLINCKIHLELSWSKDCIMPSTVGVTAFQTTNTKLYVPIVTLSTKNNVNLAKQLNEGFKRLVYCNEYKSKIEIKQANDQTLARFPLDASFKDLIYFLFLLLIILIMVLIESKETITENNFFQE